MKIPSQGLSRESLMREAAPTEFRAIIDAVRAAVVKKMFPFNTDRWINLEAVYPDHTIASADDGKLFRFDFTIDDAGTVTLSDPVAVIEQFVPIKEADSKLFGDDVFLEAQGDATAGRWLICVIRAGKSGNDNYYSDAVLKEALPLFDGARVFIKSDAEHIKGEGKAVSNLIGRLTVPKFIEGATADTGHMTAVLEFIEPEGTVAVKVREAYQRGMKDLFGFSIDATAKAKKATRNGVIVREATKLTKVLSVDLIVEPGAGGQLIRMVESLNDPLFNQEQNTMKTRMLEAIKAKNPAAYAKINPETITDDELEAAYREALLPTPAHSQNDPDLAKTVRVLEAQVRMSNATTEINASTLPQKAKDKLITDFAARESFDPAAVTAAITSEREYLANFTESGKPTFEFTDIQVEDRSVMIAGMLDAFFDPTHKDHRNVGSFKECYVEITGDKHVTGELKHVDHSRMRESLGISVREALDSTTFADALGNSITRRMQAIYAGQADLQAWRKVATINRVNDFRSQERVRIGGYGNLPAVTEGNPYVALTSPGDDKASYAVSKRGGLESVTLEMIKNDDVGAIRRVPLELALAAGNTLYEFVFDFFRTNPVTWDALALYHATHGNLFTAAFSAAEFATHRLAMLKQTRAGSAKRLATQPKFILVPFELEEPTFNAFVRNQNLDKTFVQSMVPEVIPVSYWTDATDWVTLADPNRLPVLEIGFLDGKEEPEVFVQDSPSVGSMFSNDKLTWKIRHIYGGGLLVDGEKGTTKAVVAG
jgi:hypothetical protein